MKIPLTAEQVHHQLISAGIIDDRDNVRRVVIDLKAGHYAVMHVEYICDERLLDVVRDFNGIEVKAPTIVAGQSVDCPIQDVPVMYKHDDGTISWETTPAWTHVTVELLDGMGLGSYQRSVFDAKYEVLDRCPHDASTWHARLREHR